MSQHNRVTPTINFSHVDGAGYESQPYQFDNLYFQQWMPSSPRTVIPSISSPTDTIRTNWTAPPMTTTRMNVQRPRKVSQPQGNVDPRLQSSYQCLLPPGSRPNPTVQHNPEPIMNPLARFCHQEDQPWSVLGMGLRNPQETNSRNTFLHTTDNYVHYRQGPCSDFSSNVLGSDSGYHTQPTQSVFSNEPDQLHQELSPEVMDQARNLHVVSAPNKLQDAVPIATDQRSISQYSSRSGHQKQTITCSEPGCSAVSKCQSEYKKHMLKHRKEFLCDTPGCKRAGDGFSTVNDLDRHKKSVHKIGMDKSKSWKCAAASCTTKSKVWPRLDNFKQHIERMHGDEDMGGLIKRSEYHPQELPSVVQPMSVDPVHLLAGMNTDSGVATGDLSDISLYAGSRSVSYPQSMSFSEGSASSTSQVCLSTNTLDATFSRSDATLLNNASGSLLENQTFPESTNNQLDNQSTRRKPSQVPPTSTTRIRTLAQGSSNNRNPMSRPQPSNGHQTKSEQKLQTLGKLSKAIIREIQTSSATDSLHLEKLVFRTLCAGEQAYKNSIEVSKIPSQRCSYDNCKFSGRTCDLNKHLKRHEKPYGCTYPKCHKRFGAKSDWKRHEGSQHFQQEAFYCDYNNSSGQKCGEHYYRITQFRKHLEEQHKLTSTSQVQNDLKRCKIGKNCQGQYWCGFCGAIQTLKAKRNAAWDERFDHIGHHFEKEKKSIDDWICVEESRTKEQIRKDVNREAFVDEEEGEDEEEEEEEEEEKEAAKDTDTDRDDDTDMSTAFERTSTTAGTMSLSSCSMQRTSKKRAAPADSTDSQRPSTRQRKATTIVYCCGCGHGGGTDIQGSCMQCQHIFCRSCQSESVSPHPLEEYVVHRGHSTTTSTV